MDLSTLSSMKRPCHGWSRLNADSNSLTLSDFSDDEDDDDGGGWGACCAWASAWAFRLPLLLLLFGAVDALVVALNSDDDCTRLWEGRRGVDSSLLILLPLSSSSSSPIRRLAIFDVDVEPLRPVDAMERRCCHRKLFAATTASSPSLLSLRRERCSDADPLAGTLLLVVLLSSDTRLRKADSLFWLLLQLEYAFFPK